MAKDYTLTSITDLFGRIIFNYIDGYDSNNEPKYHVARLEWHARGVNGGAEKRGTDFINLGASQSTPFTPQEIYTAVKNNLGTVPANKLKDLYIELINDDISQAR